MSRCHGDGQANLSYDACDGRVAIAVESGGRQVYGCHSVAAQRQRVASQNRLSQVIGLERSGPRSGTDMKADTLPSTDTELESLYRQHAEPLLNYLYRLLGNRSEAEEAMQDTFVKACGALERLPADANQRAWLYRIATNTASDRLRRRRLIRWLPLLASDGATPTAERPEHVAVDRTDVDRALSQLAPIYRQALWLFVVAGYDTAEIAAILGISRAAVKKRVARARAQFERAYRGEV